MLSQILQKNERWGISMYWKMPQRSFFWRIWDNIFFFSRFTDLYFFDLTFDRSKLNSRPVYCSRLYGTLIWTFWNILELCGLRRLWSNEQALQISRLENAQVVASSIVNSGTAEGLKIWGEGCKQLIKGHLKEQVLLLILPKSGRGWGGTLVPPVLRLLGTL